MVMAASQDTEITLGTGKMLGIFFALVIVCAVFFSMGFSMGKNSVVVAQSPVTTPATKAAKHVSPSDSASKPPTDMTFYKSVGQNNADSQLAPPVSPGNAPTNIGNAADTAPPASTNGYFVQVAAVSKQDDAEALVNALKKKQYSAAAAQTAADKLFHVQVGPFAELKDAETMRTQLLSDGYNPIVKK